MDILKKLYLFSPIVIFSVSGKSMLPTFFPKQKIIGLSAKCVTLKKYDVIICRDYRTGKLILKRIVKIENKNYFIEGDNKDESTDSRNFGWIKRENILAKVIYPKTVYNT